MSLRPGPIARILFISSLVAAPTAHGFEFLGIKFGGDKEEEAPPQIVDPFPYTIGFNVGTPIEGLRDALRGSSALWNDRKTPASGAAGLISTAQADYRALLATLYARGYYAGAISIRIDGREAADMSLADSLKAPAQVLISIDPGPRFVFGRTEFVNPAPRSGDLPERGKNPAQDVFRPGEPARADVINAAGDQEVEEWRRAGHPKARVAEREVIADHGRTALDVTIRMDPGPDARFGKVTVGNTGGVDAEFVRYMADIPEGARFHPDRLQEASDRINGLRAFRAVRVEEGAEVGPDGTLPITIEAVRRPPRRFGVGATFSSLEGFGVEAFWLHRNLLGRAERFRIDAGISGIGTEGDVADYDYSLGFNFTKPGFLDQPNSLVIEGETAQNVFETYTERTVGGSVGIERQFNDRLSGSVALAAAYSDIEDDQGNRDFLIFSLPTGLTYDRRNDEYDPTEGYYLSGELRPFYETEYSSLGLRAEMEGRKYFGFFEDRTVLALRAKYGTVLDGDLVSIPPDFLYFAGGGGSVRGYAYRSIGVELGGDTVGGRSTIEVSAELRQRIGTSLGVAAFVDGGAVSSDTFPDGLTDVQFGAGLGLRYYTGIGPLRFDIAAPIDPRPEDPSVAFYIGIGQSF